MAFGQLAFEVMLAFSETAAKKLENPSPTPESVNSQSELLVTNPAGTCSFRHVDLYVSYIQHITEMRCWS
jgi:hypothetical protein